MIADLAALRAAAEANGTPVAVISGYRSHDYQANLFADRVTEVGEAEAVRTARPGQRAPARHGHRRARPRGRRSHDRLAQTPAGQWVNAHAHEYGFVLSYPEGARADLLRVRALAPALRRRDVAAAIHESEMTAREWMLAERADNEG